MQEMAVSVFLELLGVRRSSGQACSESGGSSGERAPGVWIWLCPALELSLEQPRGFLLDDCAQEHLLCWAAAGLSKAAQGCPGCSSPAALSCGMGTAPLIPVWMVELQPGKTLSAW